ncbi:MAG: peptide chain release factor 1 [Caldiserica bacterium]|jgi:peptide chain release factor 1|nr:peptide chain release factor 1 [Caldisericota bacterium]MDH7562770.1 peptide chain release factor 1 [Caldisericota bacterium]
MLEQKEKIQTKKDELERKLLDPVVQQDPKALQKYSIAYHQVTSILEKMEELEEIQKAIEKTRPLLNEKDPELNLLAEQEIENLKIRESALEREIKILLVPKDPADEKSVIVEIRAAAGGEEAALFAADLFRMYANYAEKKNWELEILSSNPTDLGGFKEIIFGLKGKNVYSRLKFEGGAHRVQRVPVTEASGRIHTSTVTVAVLPEAEEVDVQINPDDLRIDVFRASGHGGQCVQKTDSAVRITHIPTGIVVSCQDERSQLKNKERAMRILRSRILEIAQRDQAEKITESRRVQVKTGERAEKIRTYNFPQNRVTDHRINLDLYNLQAILDGELDELLDALESNYIEKKLEEGLLLPF